MGGRSTRPIWDSIKDSPLFALTNHSFPQFLLFSKSPSYDASKQQLFRPFPTRQQCYRAQPYRLYRCHNMISMSIARLPRHFNHMGHEKDSTFSNTALTSPLANIASESEEYCKRVERRVRELESENRVLRTELAARQSVGVATDPYSAAVPEPPSRTWNHIFFKPIPILTAFRRTSETP